jgi:hypothetical protein
MIFESSASPVVRAISLAASFTENDLCVQLFEDTVSLTGIFDPFKKELATTIEQV